MVSLLNVSGVLKNTNKIYRDIVKRNPIGKYIAEGFIYPLKRIILFEDSLFFAFIYDLRSAVMGSKGRDVAKIVNAIRKSYEGDYKFIYNELLNLFKEEVMCRDIGGMNIGETIIKPTFGNDHIILEVKNTDDICFNYVVVVIPFVKWYRERHVKYAIPYIGFIIDIMVDMREYILG